jgi:hypothetical protein
MSLPNNPSVNGLYPDWSTVVIELPGTPGIGRGCTDISYNAKNEKGKARGTQQQVLGFTPGEYDAEGSITLHAAFALELLRSLGTGYLSTFFPITVSYPATTALNAPLIVDRLVGCILKGENNEYKQSGDPLMRKYDMDILYYTTNGIAPLFNMRL